MLIYINIEWEKYLEKTQDSLQMHDSPVRVAFSYSDEFYEGLLQ